MGTIELKSNIHQIVDEIQSEQLLKTIYDFLKIRENSQSSGVWNILTQEQKQEVLLAYEEAEDENNLIDRKKIFGK